MKRTTLRSTALATVAAFGAICLAPRGASADDVPGEVPVRRAPVAQQPAQPQPPPPAYPAYPAYPPGYQPAPGYQNPAPYPQQYPPGYQAPPAYQTYPPMGPMKMKLVERPRYGMAITGAAIFGGLWLTTSAIAYASDNNAAIIPIIGPLFYLKGDDAGFGSQTSNRLDNVGLMMVTLGQATGAILFIAGLAMKDRVWVRETEVSVIPTVLPNGGGGLAAVGRF